jgi:hypothetical protein
MNNTPDRLYKLLPAIHRLRDLEQGEPLRLLLAIIAEQVGLVEADIGRLYDNWFIETCDEWLVPYRGDLLGVRGLHQISPTGFTQRATVANTLSYRRRKGTATMLEQLARDTTLWPARAVEFFELLSTTQYLNHLRLHSLATPDLRQANTLALLDTPFNAIAHTAEVRRIAVERGQVNIPNVGLFLWRLVAYPLSQITPRAVTQPADGRYSFASLGYDAPLFNRPQTEETISHLAGETNVPDAIRPLAFHLDLAAYQTQNAAIPAPDRPQNSVYYGPDASLMLERDGQPVNPIDVVCMNLSDWARPPSGQVGLDVSRGRIAFALGETPGQVTATYRYGFSGDLGGGPYDRRRLVDPGQPLPEPYLNSVAAPAGLGLLLKVSGSDFDTLAAALGQWQALGQPDAVIQIEDSRTYEEDLAIPMTAADLVIQAKNNERPTLIGNIAVSGSVEGRLALDGLLIAGSLVVGPGHSLRQLNLSHCTFVPGVSLDLSGRPQQPETPSLTVQAPNDHLRLRLERCLSGPLRLPAELISLHVEDSLIESPRRGQPAKVTPALVSGSLASFPALGPAQPVLQVTIGQEGPHRVTLANKPASLAPARDLLQAAIRAAHPSPTFSEARVISAENRLIVLPGWPAPVTINPTETDDSADLLRLSPGNGQAIYALVSGPLAPFPTLRAAAPELKVTLGEESGLATLAAVPTSLAQARDQLQTAIRAAGASPAFTAALVGSLNDTQQLVVAPGSGQVAPRFAVTPVDSTTLADLALGSSVPALAASPAGEQPGPATTLVRATLLGPVHLKELVLASEVIFSDPALAERRQTGCVRFSYVPPGSRLPRRYRCQPDVEIARQVAAAGGEEALPPAVQAAIRQRVLSWLKPSFTSTRYGDPAYGQLSLTCPEPITTGAEDGSEMGVFSFLKQPQREANLRASLDEYLRFGLEAGIFYVT